MASDTRPLTSVPAERFFLLTFVLSWAIWAPLVASRSGLLPAMADGTRSLLGLFGVLMPATSALILTARTGGRPALGRLLSRLRIWRVGGGWWLAAVLLQPVLLIGAGVAANVLSGSTEVPWTPPESAGYMIVTVVFLLIAVLGEEIGWRGVALPALQRRVSVLVASLVLGVIWAIWHLPFWLLQTSYTQFGPGYIGLNLLLIVPFSAYISWFFNNTRYSILLPVCFHLGFNILNTMLFQATMSILAFAILIVSEWVVGLLLLPRLDRQAPPEAAGLASRAAAAA